MKKNILVIGSGGREHALGWKVAKSSRCGRLYFAPGNGGTQKIGINMEIKAESIDKLLQFAREKNIDLTVVGPEVPLAQGVVDNFQKRGLKIFGPGKKAARLESSKAWALKFMAEAGIPHPVSEIFQDYNEALNYINRQDGDCVVKADGLAAGKGVFVCNTKNEAKSALQKIMLERVFGDAGNTVVIQEKLVGREVSVMAFCDGKIAVPIIAAQDYKRVWDHDKGPNTGGMGAFAKAKIGTRLLEKMQRLLTLVVEQLAEDGGPYVGVLYGGFMLVDDKPYVLEFNCRMGDPEAQVQLPLLESDLVKIIENCVSGSLRPELVKFSDKSALTVILASDGYPGNYETGMPINGLANIEDKSLIVFHAGTKVNNGRLLTTGGRVLAVTATADSLEKARAKVYSGIGDAGIYFDGMHYRKDIGGKDYSV